MAILKQRLCKQTTGSDYDTIYLETSTDVIVRPSGESLETVLTNLLNKTPVSGAQTPPSTVEPGKLIVVQDGTIYVGGPDGTPKEVMVVGGKYDVGTIDNILKVNGLTADQFIDKLIEKGVGVGNSGGTTGPAGIRDYSDIITGVITGGSVVQMAGKDWLVCHVDTDLKTFFMITNTIQSMTQFGSNNIYVGSTIAGVADTFEKSLPANVLSKMISLTFGGVTSKVHIPSKEQMGGGFTWFKDAAHRIAVDSAGAAQTYWTCTPYSSNNVCYVSTAGAINGSNVPSTTYGFRPFVAFPF